MAARPDLLRGRLIDFREGRVAEWVGPSRTRVVRRGPRAALADEVAALHAEWMQRAGRPAPVLRQPSSSPSPGTADRVCPDDPRRDRDESQRPSRLKPSRGRWLRQISEGS